MEASLPLLTLCRDNLCYICRREACVLKGTLEIDSNRRPEWNAYLWPQHPIAGRASTT
jgi:hypothetical protein